MALSTLLSSSSPGNTFAHTYSNTQSIFLYQSHLSPFPFCPSLSGFIIACSTSFIYVMISLELVTSVKSKLGLIFAFICQYILSMSTALTIVSFIFPSFAASSLRKLLLIPIFVFITIFDNPICLLNAVGRTPREYRPSARLLIPMKTTIMKTITGLAIYLVLLLTSCIIFFKNLPAGCSNMFICSTLFYHKLLHAYDIFFGNYLC